VCVTYVNISYFTIYNLEVGLSRRVKFYCKIQTLTAHFRFHIIMTLFSLIEGGSFDDTGVTSLTTLGDANVIKMTQFVHEDANTIAWRPEGLEIMVQ
jgi:hypothetical protein